MNRRLFLRLASLAAPALALAGLPSASRPASTTIMVSGEPMPWWDALGDYVVVQRTGEVMRVTAVHDGKITVQRGDHAN